MSGSGNLGASSPEVIATLPALGAQLQTDGDPDADFTISLANTGAATINFFCPNGGGIALPTGVVPSGVTTDNTMVCMAWNEADPSGPSRSLIFCSDDVFDGVARCEVLRA